MGYEERRNHMTRILIFTKDDTRKFELFYTGFVTGGNFVHRNGDRTRDERAKEAKIVRAIKNISEDAGETRTLSKSGGVIELEIEPFRLLEKYVENAPFNTQISDEIMDLLEWISVAEKKECA